MHVNGRVCPAAQQLTSDPATTEVVGDLLLPYLTKVTLAKLNSSEGADV